MGPAAATSLGRWKESRCVCVSVRGGDRARYMHSLDCLCVSTCLSSHILSIGFVIFIYLYIYIYISYLSIYIIYLFICQKDILLQQLVSELLPGSDWL